LPRIGNICSTPFKAVKVEFEVLEVLRQRRTMASRHMTADGQANPDRRHRFRAKENLVVRQLCHDPEMSTRLQVEAEPWSRAEYGANTISQRAWSHTAGREWDKGGQQKLTVGESTQATTGWSPTWHAHPDPRKTKVSAAPTFRAVVSAARFKTWRRCACLRPTWRRKKAGSAGQS